jgi:cyclophilin family peptidyl-prolyl cis-trans isomerase
MYKIILIIIFVVLVIGGGFWYFSPKTYTIVPVSQETATTTDNFSYSTSTAPVSAANTSVPASAPTITNNNQANIMQATLHTSLGDITIEFDSKNAPVTSANFIKLAQSGFYDGTKFHRVIKGFMDQGGDPLTKDDSQMAQWGTGGPGYQFADENVNADNAVGVVSMANSGPNTNGSQFFINAANNSFLDGKYSVFGKVVAGMDVVTAINNTPTDANDRPVVPVVITSVTLQ